MSNEERCGVCACGEQSPFGILEGEKIRWLCKECLLSGISNGWSGGLSAEFGLNTKGEIELIDRRAIPWLSS
jgi:hypothetical protein